MLTSDDVIDLFSAMRTAYGGQWKHGNEAVSVWRNALARYDAAQLQRAAGSAMHHYVNHPPTLPQFLDLLRERRSPTTYLPPPDMPRENVIANKVLLRVLLNVGGVDRHCMRNLVALKNALLEEHETLTQAGIDDIDAQLLALAASHDREAKVRETLEEREKFCRRQGMEWRG